MKTFISPELRALTGPFTRIARAMADNFNVEVIPSGKECKTDGKRIYVPFTADYLPADKRQALNGLLDHEVAHVAEEGTHKHADRKTCLDIMKDAALCRAQKMLFNVFEDIRIETKYSAKYPGVAQNLNAANKNCFRRYVDEGVEGMSGWLVIGVAVIAKARGFDCSWLPKEYEPYVELLQDEIDDCKKMVWSEDALDLANRAFEKLKEFDEPPPPEDGSADGEGEGGDGDDCDAEDAEDGEETDGELAEAKERKGKGRKFLLLKKDAERADLLDKLKEDMEADVDRDMKMHRRYVPHPEMAKLDRCFKEDKGSLLVYEAAKKDVLSQIGALRSRQMMLLQTMLKARIQGGMDEGELDDAEMHRVRNGDMSVFADLVLAQKLGTAIELLIDISGSMRSNAYEGCPAYYALRTAVALAESWESLRIPYEAMGFTNLTNSHTYHKFTERTSFYGRGTHDGYVMRAPFSYPIYKGWNERLQNCRERFSKIEGHDDNADGEAVMFAALRLAARREKRKILIVISDGMPAACGVDDGMNNGYLKEVVKKVEASGIEVVGIGAGTDAPKHFYTNSIVINDMSTMATTVFKAIDKRIRRKVA